MLKFWSVHRSVGTLVRPLLICDLSDQDLVLDVEGLISDVPGHIVLEDEVLGLEVELELVLDVGSLIADVPSHAVFEEEVGLQVELFLVLGDLPFNCCHDLLEIVLPLLLPVLDVEGRCSSGQVAAHRRATDQHHHLFAETRDCFRHL